MAEVIDGKAAAAAVLEEVTAGAAALRERGIVPGLDVVLVGEDPASQTYVRNKLRTAERVGIRSRDHVLPATVSQAHVEGLIADLNADPAVHGILVQCPVPAPLDQRRVLDAVDPRKDVDGLHPYNAGRLLHGGTPMPPCTPAGVMELLRRSGVTVAGSEAVVVGRSDLVGKPLALLLLHEHATVTVCHSRTRELAAVCRRADILVAAVGRPGLLGADHVREGAVVIDVGINRVAGRLVGDVDFDAAASRARLITPVPGGVGPMTIAMLMRNTLTAARLATGVH